MDSHTSGGRFYGDRTLLRGAREALPRWKRVITGRSEETPLVLSSQRKRAHALGRHFIYSENKPCRLVPAPDRGLGEEHTRALFSNTQREAGEPAFPSLAWGVHRRASQRGHSPRVATPGQAAASAAGQGEPFLRLGIYIYFNHILQISSSSLRFTIKIK